MKRRRSNWHNLMGQSTSDMENGAQCGGGGVSTGIKLDLVMRRM